MLKNGEEKVDSEIKSGLWKYFSSIDVKGAKLLIIYFQLPIASLLFLLLL